MNVWFILSTPFPPVEGIGNFVFNLTKTLLYRGHSITVVTRGGTNHKGMEDIDGVRCIRPPFLPLHPFHVSIHGLFVKKCIKSFEDQIDVLHFNSPLCPYVHSKVPSVATFHTPMKADVRSVELVDPKSLAIKLQASISIRHERNLLMHANVLTAVSRSVAIEIREYGIDLGLIGILGNGVDVKVFSPAKKKDERRYVLFVGRLAYRKGIDDFIRAAKMINKNHKDVSFVIVGEGPLRSRIVSEITKLNIRDKFIMLGYVSQARLVELYKHATTFVLPSHYEGLPTVLLEAMACEIPVVATEVGGVPEVITNRRDGILVPPHDPRKISQAVKMLLDDGTMRRKISHNARKKILQNYTWDCVADRTEICYEEMFNVICGQR